MAYSHQDWKQVILRPKQEGNGKSEKDIRRALQTGGVVETHVKLHSPFASKKLDENPEDFHHKTISKELADAVKNKRIEMKLTQAQLAQKVNEKVNIIQDIENMKGVYNHVIINKTLRALGLSLKDMKK